MFKNKKNVVVACALVVVVVGGFYIQRAFGSPSQSAGTGYGLIAVDASNNTSIGAVAPTSSTRLFVLGTTTDSTSYALKLGNSAGVGLFTVRSDGKVTIGANIVPASSLLRVQGQIESTSGGFVFPDGTIQTSAGIGSSSITAGNVSAGNFGSNVSGGNYSFPAYLAIGTTTYNYALTVNGQISAANNRVLNVATPVASSDAATKAYVDGLGSGSYNGHSATCNSNNCTATATCTAGTVVMWAVGSQASNNCDQEIGSSSIVRQLSCIGNSSCGVAELGLLNQACVQIICAR